MERREGVYRTLFGRGGAPAYETRYKFYCCGGHRVKQLELSPSYPIPGTDFLRGSHQESTTTPGDRCHKIGTKGTRKCSVLSNVQRDLNPLQRWTHDEIAR